ncbi:M1 family metallopeptidase [Winogradskyella bathintestinalis]|uniref:Aminopeptidase N n=1 Tax=Winogradskyella bathintestinalis TaxID=3035208 RepID=A0ABT7ZXD0_9FLAO|nr:M1 family metallopeptidase [Winogradskyella bathintestinalis]MDN3493667.1 M1 family metallopeptidase [Winogradskyella bathintestinalis]
MKNFQIIIYLLIFSFSSAQQTEFLDYLKLDADIRFKPDSAKVLGSGTYAFKILKAVDSIYLDAKKIKFESVKLLNEASNNFSFKNTEDKLWLKFNFQKDKTYQLSFQYEATPKKALYFIKRKRDWQIWTQGQGKYTSNWLPSIDDVNDKIEFDLSITYPNGYQALANGKLIDKQIGDSLTRWSYDMQKPMSSYLVALVIGEYKKKIETSANGIPLEYYYYSEDSLKVEPTYRYSKQMFNFLEEEIGVGYPWQNYKQVPVHDFLYAGMENTSLTIFSDAFVVDAIGFNDKNYVNVNAHELAHQWFGNLVTAQSGEHHWLQEGFSTYYAALAERDVFGDDQFYFNLLESAIDLGKQDISGSGTSLLNPEASSLTFYQRGAWVLHALRTKVGDQVFKGAIKNYIAKHQFKNVETSDFIKEIERLYGQSLSGFVNLWIKQKAFPVDNAFDILQQQSTYINEFLMVDCQAKSSKCADYLKYYVSEEAKAKIISQVPELVTPATFNNGLIVRQAISQYVRQIPKSLKERYESLLDDASYITIENALYNLWTSFPEERSKYLFKTRNIQGFHDKNVRLLWIVLNLSTPFYDADNKQALFNELVDYTGDAYNADLRMNAFRYLKMINSCKEECLVNLENAKSHHNWRLVKFAKQLTEELQQKN